MVDQDGQVADEAGAIVPEGIVAGEMVREMETVMEMVNLRGIEVVIMYVKGDVV